MSSETPQTEASAGTTRHFWFAVLAVAGSATLFAIFLKNTNYPQAGGLATGESAVPLQAVGWLNGDAPATMPPPGKVRVLHAWSTNCVPCIREATELVKLHAQYQNDGVEFVGITYEPPQRLADVRKFLGDTGIT
ncbi:MAG: TlpA family protein disulfide reductase, partial [Planctomycetaceae bacterium]|nr:TlpA family protein disulfide reductase [Planctomycetaceae bacterium]